MQFHRMHCVGKYFIVSFQGVYVFQNTTLPKRWDTDKFTARKYSGQILLNADVMSGILSG